MAGTGAAATHLQARRCTCANAEEKKQDADTLADPVERRVRRHRPRQTKHRNAQRTRAHTRTHTTLPTLSSLPNEWRARAAAAMLPPISLIDPQSVLVYREIVGIRRPHTKIN